MVLMSIKLTCWDVLCFAALIALTGQLNDKKDNATTHMSESTIMTERHNFFHAASVFANNANDHSTLTE